MSLLGNMSVSLWLLLGLALMIAEALVPGVFLIWFGLGAFCAAGLLALIPALDWHWQWVFFGVMSTTALVGGRAWRARHPVEHDHPTLNRRGQQYVGRQFTLHAPIVDGIGRLQVDDTVWRVAGDNLPAGTRVEVAGVDGTLLQVRRVDA